MKQYSTSLQIIHKRLNQNRVFAASVFLRSVLDTDTQAASFFTNTNAVRKLQFRNLTDGAAFDTQFSHIAIKGLYLQNAFGVSFPLL